MAIVLVNRTDAIQHGDLDGKTFGDVVRVGATHLPGLTWQQLARYNWGTAIPAEVNRALAETIGVASIDPVNPALTRLAVKAGPPGGVILLPKPWQGSQLAAEKSHRVKVARPRAAPAIGLARVTPWFHPERNELCEIEFQLEGDGGRADTVDVEVHATGYFALDAGGSEVASPTTGTANSTHIYQVRSAYKGTGVPPATAVPYRKWRGESQATKGILAATGTARVVINAACAPYPVMVRYYRDNADADAVMLLEPFSPRYLASGALDEESLVVRWSIRGDNDKLTIGQLLVLDNKGAVVFRAGLSKKRLRDDRLYDLLRDPDHPWDKTQIRRDAMPYRVQLQAHSAAAVDDGLAIAVMHTAVKPFVYNRAQLIGFNVKPGTTSGPPTAYLGDFDDDTDIAARAGVMIKAVREAAASSHIDQSDDVLKVFMAPEFYFRGQRGGYLAEKLSTILPKLRTETDRFEYADWLFCFGTAIGYLASAPTPQSRRHQGTVIDNAWCAATTVAGNATNVDIDSHACGWVSALVGAGVPVALEVGGGNHLIKSVTIVGPQRCTIDLKTAAAVGPRAPATLRAPAAYVLSQLHLVDQGKEFTEVRLHFDYAIRIPFAIGAGAGAGWVVEQGTVKAEVASAAHDSDTFCRLRVPGKLSFTPGNATLVEPDTEVFNVALLQKGWSCARLGAADLRSALVYKEYVSPIDFLGENFGQGAFHTLGGRLIEIAGAGGRRVLPTGGSRDLLGAVPQPPGPPTKTVSQLKDGKGNVLGTVNWTSGTEVNRSGLGGGSVVTMHGVTIGVEVCLDHAKNKLHDFYASHAKKGDPRTQIHLIPSWGMSIGGGKVAALDQGLVFNVDGARASAGNVNVAVVGREFDHSYRCDIHLSQVGSKGGNCPQCHQDTYWFNCIACSKTFRTTAAGGCPSCGALSSMLKQCTGCSGLVVVAAHACGTCMTSNFTTVFPVDRPFAEMGPSIPELEQRVVSPATWVTHFEWGGEVVVLAVRALPAPALV